MNHIRANAEFCVRQLLRDVVKRMGSNILEAVDYLDDGSPVSLDLRIEHFLNSLLIGAPLPDLS